MQPIALPSYEKHPSTFGNSALARAIIVLEPIVPCDWNRTNFKCARCHTGITKGKSMKKAALIIATIAALGATAVTAPAEARGRGFGGAGIGLGIAAGALAAGAYGAYGPGYGYGYGPRYYGPRYAYGDGYYGRSPRYYNRYGYY
jgi:hypothetical protein